jgi:hypothetical protein
MEKRENRPSATARGLAASNNDKSRRAWWSQRRLELLLTRAGNACVFET